MLKDVETVENTVSRDDALSAAAAMDTAERRYNSLQTEGQRQIIRVAMSKQWERSEDFDGQPQRKDVTISGRKRGIDEAFPEYYESETKVV